MNWEFALPIIWSAIIAVGVIIYVILDGFDLGVGILFPFVKNDNHKTLMMNSIAPFWDGNETWLILGGAGLFGAFPLVYATVLPAMYIPLTIFIVAIILRGVSFEFRYKAQHSRPLWDGVFAVGSTLMSFCQGLVLGTFVKGFQMNGSEFIGGSFDWLSPFAFFCGISVVIGYALLGSTWLIMKTNGELQLIMYRYSRALTILIMITIAVVSLWTPFISHEIFTRWFTTPNIYYLWVIPLVTAYCALKLFNDLWKESSEYKPFYYTISLFILSYLGLAVSIWPYIIPREVDIWQAAAPVASQGFLLVGTAIILPIVLIYTWNVYRVFKGKAEERMSGY
jgi:cytochrome d ubiquinol oxidase subunit II